MSRFDLITPCLWFDREAEEAARYYCEIFRNSKLGDVARYGTSGYGVHHQPAGSVMSVAFELNGQPFTALNSGADCTTMERAVQVFCDTQEEVDAVWSKLAAGGDPAVQRCGWLKDRFGVAWHIIPRGLPELMKDPSDPGSQRAMSAMLQMRKLDMRALERAYAGSV